MELVRGIDGINGAAARAGCSSADVLQAIQTVGSERAHPSGVCLVRQGQMVTTVYAVLSGLVKSVHVSFSGKEVMASLSGSGSIIGASALLLASASPVSAVTVGPCRLIDVLADRFLALLSANPAMALLLCRIQSRKLYDQTLRMLHLVCGSSDRRLLHCLTSLIGTGFCAPPATNPTGFRIRLPLREYEIAKFLAISPSHLSRLLRKLEAQRLIVRHKGWIVLRLSTVQALQAEDPLTPFPSPDPRAQPNLRDAA